MSAAIDRTNLLNIKSLFGESIDHTLIRFGTISVARSLDRHVRRPGGERVKTNTAFI